MRKTLNTAFKLGKSGDSSELSKLIALFPHMAEDLRVEYRLGQNQTQREYHQKRFLTNTKQHP